ncbi:hypothetical protein CLOLEP_01105 [[Clostridium] leptum DSM 753]|uniref:Uncharacterized protein n=1 Tax=[Clostridium] leptum DSM 753 TaxID=428125 RepID=A7VRC3_9FIRM|nr:hypothetical protein CLOLEP_01105 [[Clostridium] leptum DSM 753]
MCYIETNFVYEHNRNAGGLALKTPAASITLTGMER